MHGRNGMRGRERGGRDRQRKYEAMRSKRQVMYSCPKPTLINIILENESDHSSRGNKKNYGTGGEWMNCCPKLT